MNLFKKLFNNNKIDIINFEKLFILLGLYINDSIPRIGGNNEE